MKKSETGFITRIVTLIMVCVMALSLIPNVSANATTTSKSTAYKSTKTMTCYLAGRERKTITMPADIAKISFGSQSAVKMRKASSRKVVVSGIRNGKTKFTVITKDKRRIVCNVVRTTKFTMGPSKKRVINTNIKLKYVKSSNKKLATVKLAKNKKSFTVTTTSIVCSERSLSVNVVRPSPCGFITKEPYKKLVVTTPGFESPTTSYSSFPDK